MSSEQKAGNSKADETADRKVADGDEKIPEESKKTDDADQKVADGTETKSRTVILTTGNTSFTVSRTMLTRHSQYFDAMLNGSFKEANQRQIFLHNITPDAMEFILHFFNFNTICITNLDHVGDVLHAANYFGLETLQSKVEAELLTYINNKTCFKVFQISKEHHLSCLEQKTKSFILYSFDDVKENIGDIQDINTLFWYLSHSNLNVKNELDVFSAGCNWLTERSDNNENNILVVLSSLIYHNVDITSLKSILSNTLIVENNIAKSIVKSMIHVLETFSFDSLLRFEHEKELHDFCGKETYDTICGLLTSRKNRSLPIKPCISLKKSNKYLDILSFNHNEKKLVQILSISYQHWWGHNIVAWKGFTIFLFGGKMRNNDYWNYDMRTYNFITNKWEILTSQLLSPRRHATVVVNDDLIYVIGGFGQFRVILNSVHVYDIKNSTWSQLPDLPEYSSCLVACFHKGDLYVSGEHFYVYRSDRWHTLGALRATHSAIVSHEEHFYFAEKWVKKLYFWKDVASCDTGEKTILKQSHYNVSAICKIGNIAYIFSEGDSIDNVNAVEMCTLDDDPKEDPVSETELLWLDTDTDATYVLDCFTLADLDIVDDSINKYGERWL